MEDPYEVPQAELADPSKPPGELPPEDKRVLWGPDEATVRSLGKAFACIGVAFSLYFLLLELRLFEHRDELASYFKAGQGPFDLAAAVLGALSLTSFGVSVCGYGLWRLEPGARIPGVVAGLFLALNVPVGTVLGFYAVRLLVRERTRRVLSEDYATAVRESPRFVEPPRTATLAIWIPSWLLLAMAGWGIFIAL